MFRQQWIGVTLVTVELEIGFGQFDFLCLLVLTETNDAICICDVRPGLQQSSQFGVVLTDEQRLVNIQQSDDKYNGQRTTAINAELSGLAHHYRLEQTEQGRKNTKDKDEKP